MAITTTTTVKNQIKQLIAEYYPSNRCTAVAWLGWQAPTREDRVKVTEYIADCYIGSEATEDRRVWDNGNAPEMHITVLGDIENVRLHALIVSDEGNHAPEVLRCAGESICLVDIAEELDNMPHD